jgi:hypothetical protein
MFSVEYGGKWNTAQMFAEPPLEHKYDVDTHAQNTV